MAAVLPSAVNRWAPVALYMAAIFFVSTIPNLAVPDGTSDKSWHFAEYGGLAVVVCRALAGGVGRRLRPLLLLAAIAICVGYALTDEVHQSFVPGRVSDWTDGAADSIGASAGAAAMWVWGIISSRARERSERDGL